MAIEIWRRVGYLARGLCQQQRRAEKRDVFRHFRSLSFLGLSRFRSAKADQREDQIEHGCAVSAVDGGRRCAVPPYTTYYGIYLAGQARPRP